MKRKPLLHIVAIFLLHALLFIFLPVGLAAENKGATELSDASIFLLPMQKVYLHTDKDAWHVDERIWFKAYVVDASTHRPDTLSGNLYAELINAQGKHIRSNVLLLRDGIAHSDFVLPDSLPDGNYTIRAYTSWMRNFSEDNIFSKNIYIHNPEQKNYIRWSERRQNRRFNRRLSQEQEETRFSFYPEGGQFVAGLKNKVAFKASNTLGQGRDISGHIFDDKGNEVISFESLHNGMGWFHITPLYGRQYFAEVSFGDGHEQRFALPKASESGFRLQVSQTKDALNVDVHEAVSAQYEYFSDNISLQIRNLEQLLYYKNDILADGAFSASVPVSELPAGMARVTLFNGSHEPIAHRNIFIRHPSKHPRIDVSHQIIAGVEKGTASIELDIAPGLPGRDFVPGSYSMSVLSINRGKYPEHIGLLSYLMLESEIMAAISHPGLFPGHGNGLTDEAIDLLMLTHAWQRFELEAAYASELPEIHYGFGRGLAVSGTVNALASDKSVEGIEVEMYVNGDRSTIYTATTDKDGRFVFSGLHYDGVFTVNLSTPSHENGRNLWVDLDRGALKAVPYSMDMHTRPHAVLSRGDDWERVDRPGTRLRQAQRSKPKLGEHFFGRPDQVIYSHDIEGHYSHMMDLLINRVSNLTIEGGRMHFRGQTGGLMDDEPLFVVDGVMVHASTFMSVNPTDVERLEVMRGSGAAIFGSRGGSGALIIFTKRGDESSRRNFEFTLSGYRIPADFYRQDLTNEVYRQLGLSKTLLWEPMLEIEPGKVSRFSIPIEDPDAFIMLFIEGINEEGQAISVRKRIE